MSKDFSLLILVAAALLVFCVALPPEVTIKCPVCEYPNGATGVTSAHLRPLSCKRNEACNVIHKRYWFDPVTLHRCTCEEEHPYADREQWQENGDDHTMFINLRAQIKFCNPVAKELPLCSANSIALTTRLAVKTEREVSEYSEITAKCFCPKFNYYKLLDVAVTGNKTVKKTQNYSCTPYEKCYTGDFCGYITAKGYQTYYVCTCPQNHMCLMKDRMKFSIMEALFEGEAYRGYCVPWSRAQKP